MAARPAPEPASGSLAPGLQPQPTGAPTDAVTVQLGSSTLPVVQRPVRPTPPRRHPQQQPSQQHRGDAGCWPRQHPTLTEPPPPPPVPAASPASCRPAPPAPAADDLAHPRTLHFVCWQAAKSGILPPRGFLRLYVERVPSWLRRRASDVELAQAVETLQLLRWVPRQELGEALGEALERRAPASKLPLRRMVRWLRKQQQQQQQ